MTRKTVEDFKNERLELNEILLRKGDKHLKRFFNLDHHVYEDGELDSKTKEMLGLVASLVLRCDDCISYHVIRCVEEGVSDPEMYEVFNVGLVVGGSIVIPHLRRAAGTLEELRAAEGTEPVS